MDSMYYEYAFVKNIDNDSLNLITQKLYKEGIKINAKIRITALTMALHFLFIVSGCGNNLATSNSEVSSNAESTTAISGLVNNEKDLTASLDEAAKKINFYGIMAIYSGDEKVWSYDNGYANKETGELNGNDKVYRVGSITKQFTAAGICILYDDRLLDINDKLSKYYPNCSYGDKVTIKDMLNMTSGIPDVFTVDKISPTDSRCLEESKLDFKVSSDNTAEENKSSIENCIISKELKFEPQTKFEYSNSNYFLLGRIIEKVSETTYEDYITENIFNPLNMNSSNFDDSKLNTKGYKLDSVATEEQVLKNNETGWILYPGAAFAYAGMNSTVEDLHKWLISLTTGKILKPETYELMTGVTNLSVGVEGLSYGFGLYTTQHDRFFHPGAYGSYLADVICCNIESIDKNYELIYLSNYHNGDSCAYDDGYIINKFLELQTDYKS